MRLNKKGFTLVELLAVVVILGIIMMVSIPAVSRWINKGKEDSLESQKKTLLMAAQSYAQGNSRVLPRNIGESKTIKAIDLKNANYLKDDLKNADKKDCMEKSFVRVYKYSVDGYTYSAYIYCEGDEAPSEVTVGNPDIDIFFTGNTYTGPDTDRNIEDVSLSAFRIVIKGNKNDSTVGVDGYSYSISVKYNSNNPEEPYIEIFHSGSLNGGGRPKIVIEKKLSEYTNITATSQFKIIVEAYNRNGGYQKEEGYSKYGDTTPPSCGKITGQAGENEWFRTGHVSKISVKCNDEKNGSGCVKNEFVKTFDQEMTDGVITISDNAGNTRDCTVRVHQDWTYPTVTITAYKRKSDGTKDTQVGTIAANNSNRNVTISTYDNSYGDNHWLNYANFPNGIYFEVIASDNILIDKGQWYYNNSGISEFNASNLNTMNTGSSKNFTATDNKTHTYLSAEGIRRGKYEVTDKSGNKTVVNIEANIDVTSPGCTSSGGSTSWTSGDRTLTGTCSDTTSKCKANVTKAYMEDINSTVESPGTVYDNADNSTTCSANQTVKIDKTEPTCNPTKTNTGTTSGVNTTVTCSDSGSGCATGTQTDSGLKESKTYSVTDNVGNTGSCTATITSKKQWRKKTRSEKTCTLSCCGTYACGCKCSGSAITGGIASCSQLNASNCKKTAGCSWNCGTCNNSCTVGTCCGYTAWSGWSSWGGSDNKCDSATCTSEERTIYE